MKHKIRAILAKYGHTQNDLAELLGLTYQSVSIKINGHKDFTQSEIFTMIHCYGLTPEEVVDIFFSVDSKCTKKIKVDISPENKTIETV